MNHSHSHHSGQSHSRSRDLGLLVGIVGLVAGTAYCLRNHTSIGQGSRHSHSQHSLHSQHSQHPPYSQYPDHGQTRHSGMSNRNLWLMGAVGAGLAGALVCVSKKNPGGLMHRGHSGDVRLESHVTINRPPEEVYEFWKDLRNLPRVMSFIERVEPQEGKVSHWVARGPAGPTLEWDSEIVDDDPGRLLAWRSLEGSDIQTWGTVMFHRRDDNRGTEVSVAFHFTPPNNATGTAARFMSGLENAALDQNLRNLKAQLEAGEVPTARRYSTGRESMTGGQA